MPDFDVIGPNLYGAPVGGDGFDVVGAAPGQGLFAGLGPQQGRGTPAYGQQQGAPVSGLVAGMVGLPTYGGGVPGAAYLQPGAQMPPNAGQMQAGSLTGAARPQPNFGTAIGAGLRGLLDGAFGG